MRVLAFSDIHLDAVTAGRPRLSEVLTFLDQVFHIVQHENVDVVIFSGDAHDPGNVKDALYSSQLLRYMFQYLRCASAPQVVCVAGNHDVIDTDELYLGSPVTTLTPVRAAAVACLPPDQAQRLHVFDRPFTRMLRPGYALLGLPYLSRAHAAKMDVWESHAFDTAQDYSSAGVKIIVVGHKVVPGARMGSESAEMAKGQDQLFPFDRVMRLNPALVINGHYHASQDVLHESYTISIPGSPVRFTFGEIEDTIKGVFFAVLD